METIKGTSGAEGMNVNCLMTEVEIKEAIALWFQQRHGNPNVYMNMITLTNNGNYPISGASVTLTEIFLQKLNKKNNEAVSFSGEKVAEEGNSKVAEDIFLPGKKSARFQLDIE